MSMILLKNRWFAKFARKKCIHDAQLRQAIREIEKGQIDVDYGGGVIKQRIARTNQGKSGGYRSIILYLQGSRAFFVYGFSKSERDNISELEKRDFKELAKITFALSETDLLKLIEMGAYQEVQCDEKD